MRKIKFRAWNKKLNRFATEEASIQIGGEEPHVSFDDFDGNFHTAVWPLDDCEILQYTGIKDVNSVEIYEGDILKLDGSCYEVKYIYNEFVIDGYDNGDYYQGYDNSIHDWESFEVIGNIHENPELLEGEI